MLCDYHMHTRLTDAQGEPRDYAARAVAAGVAEIAFTDHMPFVKRFSDWHMPMAELPRYVGWIEEARREFPQVKILLGMELDYLPGIEGELRDLQARYEWDFFLGSVHHIDGWNFDGPNGAREWAARDVDAAWERYFRLLADAARTGLYDSMAHPDLPKKFGFRPKRDPRPLYEPFLRACAGTGAAIEISTAGLHRPCKEMYPSLEMLKIACPLGVPITFGSDAHLPEHVGRDLDKAVALAREAGYSQFCRFAKRRRSFEPL
ncbi:MAG: histidinol-phosphatase HisJ family protein [Verrucomicrobia bacterium]|nr:histidinol-phosphatase HisJ family protein [Verrucomicrobiota bacterium]